MDKETVKERILEVLRRNDNIPIKKIAKELSISVATASKYCYVLEAEKRVKIVSFGNMKIISKSGKKDVSVDISRLLPVIIVFFMILPATSMAIPNLLNVQGKLTDVNDNPRVGQFNFTFSIYTAASGGSPAWSENKQLNTTNGLFATLLGSATTLNLPFDADYYLEISVNGETLQPRYRIASNSYAFRANVTNYVASGGTALGNLAVAGILNVTGSSGFINGGGICTDNNGLCSAASAGGWNDDGPVVRLTTIGDSVGIGTVSPLQKLVVVGDANVTGNFIVGGTFLPSSVSTNSVVTTLLNVTGTANLSSSVILHATKCLAGQVLTTTTDGTVQCVADNSSGTSQLPASNISSGTFGSSTGGGDYAFPSMLTVSGLLNLTSTVNRINATQLIQLQAGGTLLFPNDAVTSAMIASLDASKLTNIAALNNAITLTASNITGDLSSWNNKIQLNAANISAGTFGGTTAYTIPENLIITRNLTVSNNLLFVNNNTGRVGVGTTNPATAFEVVGTIKIDNAVIDSQLGCEKLYTDGSGNVLCGTDSIGNISGNGTTNYIARWANGTTLGISEIYQDGTNIAVGGTVAPQKLVVVGSINATGIIYESNQTLSQRYIDEGQSAGGDLSGTYPNPAVVWGNGSNKLTLLAQNITGDLSYFNDKLLINIVNTTGDYGTTLNNKITVLAQNITGDLSYFNNKIQLNAGNITSGTFGSGDYVFPNNVNVSGTLAVGTFNPSAISSNSVVTSLLNATETVNLSGSVIVHATKCPAGQVLTTTINGTLGCVIDQGAGGVTIPPANVTGDFSVWNGLFNAAAANVTGTFSNTSISNLDANKLLNIAFLNNAITLTASNITGDLSFFNNKITLTSSNITGDLSTWNNKIQLNAANITAGTFASGDFVFPNNLSVVNNLSVGGTLSAGTFSPSSINTGSITGTLLNISGQALLATSSGNVGIGTSSPNAKLEIGGVSSGLSFNASNILFVNTTSGRVGVNVVSPQGPLEVRQAGQSPYVLIIPESSNSRIHLVGASGQAGYLSFSDAASLDLQTTNSLPIRFLPNGPEMMRVTTSGVGIGTTSTTFRLNVLGLNAINDSVGVVQTLDFKTTSLSNGTNGIGAGLLFRTSDSLNSTENASQISGILTNAANGSEAGALAFLTRTGGEALTERVRIDDLGRVGIGTTTPTQNLTVIGDANITGTLYAGTFSPSSINTGSITGTLLNISGAVNLSSTTILHATKCSAGQVLSTTADGTVQCVTDQGAGGVTVPWSNVTGFPGVTIPANNVTEGTFLGNTYNFSTNVLLHATKCSAGEVLSTTANGTVQCVADNVSAITHLPADNITAGTFGSNSGGGDYTFPNNTVVTQNFTVSNNVLFVNNNTGRVGIGALDPGEKLSVVGNIQLSGGIITPDTISIGNGASAAGGTTSIAIGSSAGAGTGAGIAIGSSSSAGGAAVSLGAGTFSNSDAIAIGGTAESRGASGIAIGFLSKANYTNSLAIGRFAHANATNATVVGLSLVNNIENSLILGRDSNPVFFINTSSGATGIGTTNPSQLLHVQGNANITGTLYAGTFAPSSIATGSITGTLLNITGATNLSSTVTLHNTKCSAGQVLSTTADGTVQCVTDQGAGGVTVPWSNVTGFPGVTIPANNVTEGTFLGNTYNFSTNVILHNTKCGAGQVLSTTANGTVQCVTDAISGNPPNNFNGPWLYNTSGQGYFNDTYANATYDTRYINTGENDAITLTAANITGDLSNWNNKLIINIANTTGDYGTSLSNKIQLNAANITAGTFASGDFVFPNNLSVVNNLSVGGTLSAGTFSPSSINTGAIDATTLNVSGETHLAYTSGNVGIGTSSPTHKLSVIGGVNITGNITVPSQFFIGTGASVVGTNSIAIGAGAATAGNSATAVGGNARSQFESVALGLIADAGPGGTSLGAGADTDDSGVAIGFLTNATGTEAIAIGERAISTGLESFAVGSSSRATNSYSIAFGSLSVSTGQNSTAFGRFTNVTGDNSFLFGIGRNSTNRLLNSAPDSFAVGRDTTLHLFLNLSNGNLGLGTTSPQEKLHVQGNANITGTLYAGTFAPSSIATGSITGTLLNISGQTLLATSSDNVGIGTSSPNQKLVVEGDFNVSTGRIFTGNNISIGLGVLAQYNEAVSIGTNASSGSIRSVAIGLGTNASGGSVAIGANTKTSSAATSSVAIGPGSLTNQNDDVAIGNFANATGPQAVSIGWFTKASGQGTIAIGLSATSESPQFFGGSITIGGTSRSSGADSIVLGSQSHASQYNATAIGNAVNASAVNAIVIGIGGGATPSTRLTNSVPNSFAVGKDTTLHLLLNLSSGNLGLGTTSPQQKLVVVGDANVTGALTVGTFVPSSISTGSITGTSLQVNGNANVTNNIYYGGNLTGYGADFAEALPMAEPVAAGDVVCFNAEMKVVKCISRAQASVAGVVSSNPTIIGNGNAKNSVPVGIVGIVKTKVKGKVNQFDMLTTSATKGYAEKATVSDFGAIIGKAMEPCTQQVCEIKVLVGLR